MTTINARVTIAAGAIATLLTMEYYMFHDLLFPFRHLLEQGSIFVLALLGLTLLLSLLSVFPIFFSERTFLRKITLPLFIFFYLFNLGSFLVSGSPIDFQQADLIVSYFQWWLGSVVENIGLAVLPLVIILIPLTILIERLPDYLNFNLSRKLYLAPIIALLLTTAGLHHSDGVFDRYPSFFRVPSLLIFAGLSDVYGGDRVEVAYSDPFGAPVEKIVLIVDESIRADLLGINVDGKETTPYLDSITSGVVDFGVASSSSNCSDYSNLILRTGLKKGEIPDTVQLSLKRPSIWQYTKKAGFSNIYLDAQSAAAWANYQNFMNEHEASFVDELSRVRQRVAYESDNAARNRLIDLLKRPGKEFIMLNKYGIHFPYFRSYPSDHNFFTPALEKGEPMNDKNRSLNSFMNGIRWSVDDWFEGLLSEGDHFRRYVIIYTSDHGQNIVDDGTLATHCRPLANRFEGIVPMMVFSNDNQILQRYRAAQRDSHNKTSHFQIFPTLLNLAGYSKSWVTANYGAPLDNPPSTPPEFFVGDIHGRGSVRKWVSIFPTGSGSHTDP